MGDTFIQHCCIYLSEVLTFCVSGLWCMWIKLTLIDVKTFFLVRIDWTHNPLDTACLVFVIFSFSSVALNAFHKAVSIIGQLK